MGREISVGIYDRQTNSYRLRDGWHICGRNDFTNDLYSLFIHRKTEFLILDIYGYDYNEVLEDKKVENCKDNGLDPLEDSSAVFINIKKFDDIIDEHINKIIKERENTLSRINSLEMVRNNTRTLQDWLDVDTFLRELKDDYEDRLSWSHQEDFKDILKKAVDECKKKKDNKIFIETCFMINDPVPNSNQDKCLPRYFPIVLFSD